MKKFIAIALFAFTALSTFGQVKYLTRTGHVSFFSDAALEDIEAHNHQVTALLEASTGKLAYKIPIKSFEFDKALMQEHFNENYMQSDKFPEATFDGVIADISKVNFNKSGTYAVTVTGKLTIHGITKDVSVTGEVIVDAAAKKVTTKANFTVALVDYGIKNDKAQKISDTIEIRVNTEMPIKK